MISEAEAEATIRYAIRAAPLGRAIPLISPRLTNPKHLATIVELIHRCWLAARGKGPPVLACVSAPPQVGKTETIQHGYAQWLAKDPADFLAYITYGQRQAEEKSARIRDLARECGVELRADTHAKDLWRTIEGGGLLARGREAGITGQSAITTIVYDDPYKNRTEAESAYKRAVIRAGYSSNVWSRRHPRTSILIPHTRWHTDDLTGTLTKPNADGTSDYERHVIAAIVMDENGEPQPLWPESGRTLEWWQETQRLTPEYDWWGMFMGEPRPHEGREFKGVHFYDTLPLGLSVTIGIDFAYSAKSSADWSIAVALGYEASRDTYYVLDVLREQCSAPEFAAKLALLRSRFPGAPMHAYIGGTEKGVVDLMRSQGLHITAHPATADKRTRALQTAHTWNRGAILVPGGIDAKGNERPVPEWVQPFTDVILDFAGTKDGRDDDADALVAAHDFASKGGEHTIGTVHAPKPWERPSLPSIGQPPTLKPPTSSRRRWE